MLEFVQIDKAKGSQDYIDDLASTLREKASLKNLEFRKNRFLAGSFRKIFDAVSRHDKLESLSLEKETLFHDDARGLKDLLRKASSLKKLKLESITEWPISDVISGSPLEGLHILGTGYDNDVHKSLPLNIAGILGNLRVLNLGYNVINDHGAVNVAKYLTQNTSLKEVDLSVNQIREAGNSYDDEPTCLGPKAMTQQTYDDSSSTQNAFFRRTHYVPQIFLP
ncbi:hypothetical protein V5799_031737, partial [Amblyomma americanum]